MKNHSLLWLGLLASSLFPKTVLTQTYIADTLAIRVLLDANGLMAVGVTEVAKTDTSNRVVSLNLSGRKLLKVTPEIGAVSALRSLVLSNNLLDTLPASLWTLSHLFELDLGDNGFKSLDARVGQLDSLLFLGLRGNALIRLPQELFTLQDLETLLLANNAIDSIPENVVDLLFLKYFDLSHNGLKAIPYTLAAMDQLDSLDLSFNVLTSLPDLITELKSTAKVSLSGNRLCTLSPFLEEWATEKDPQFKSSQVCGMAVRPQANRAGGLKLTAQVIKGEIRISGLTAGNQNDTYEVSLRDIAGSLIYSQQVRLTGSRGFPFLLVPTGRPGLLCVELGSHGRLLGRIPVRVSP